MTTEQKREEICPFKKNVNATAKKANLGACHTFEILKYYSSIKEN